MFLQFNISDYIHFYCPGTTSVCKCLTSPIYMNALPSLDISTALALYPAKISKVFKCFIFVSNTNQVDVSESSSDEELLKK